MGYLKIDYNDYEKLLSPPDPKLIQSNIIDFLIYLRDKGKSPNTISSYLAAIKHFYDMNDIILNWKKIKSFRGEFYLVVDDEAYTAEQIKLLVDNADMRDKAIILLMASSAMRAGAIPKLKIKDLSVIDEYQYLQDNSLQENP
jgi:integrase